MRHDPMCPMPSSKFMAATCLCDLITYVEERERARIRAGVIPLLAGLARYTPTADNADQTDQVINRAVVRIKAIIDAAPQDEPYNYGDYDSQRIRRMDDPDNDGSGLPMDAAPQDCARCGHAAHADECEVEVGYDHMNGSHECSCPAAAPQDEPCEKCKHPRSAHMAAPLGCYCRCWPFVAPQDEPVEMYDSLAARTRRRSEAMRASWERRRATAAAPQDEKED